MEKTAELFKRKNHYNINNFNKSQDNNDNKIKSHYTNILTLHIFS